MENHKASLTIHGGLAVSSLPAPILSSPAVGGQSRVRIHRQSESQIAAEFSVPPGQERLPGPAGLPAPIVARIAAYLAGECLAGDFDYVCRSSSMGFDVDSQSEDFRNELVRCNGNLLSERRYGGEISYDDLKRAVEGGLRPNPFFKLLTPEQVAELRDIEARNKPKDPAADVAAAISDSADVENLLVIYLKTARGRAVAEQFSSRDNKLTTKDVAEALRELPAQLPDGQAKVFTRLEVSLLSLCIEKAARQFGMDPDPEKIEFHRAVAAGTYPFSAMQKVRDSCFARFNEAEAVAAWGPAWTQFGGLDAWFAAGGREDAVEMLRKEAISSAKSMGHWDGIGSREWRIKMIHGAIRRAVHKIEEEQTRLQIGAALAPAGGCCTIS